MEHAGTMSCRHEKRYHTFKTSDSLVKCKSAVLPGREPAHMCKKRYHRTLWEGGNNSSQYSGAKILSLVPKII